jgi:pantoate--beta-alanine ligase
MTSSTPLVLATPAEMRARSTTHVRAGRTIALVPTMGALHEGHIALVGAARAAADVVVVSIFVNPLQFGDPTDFTTYPRPAEADLQVCAAAGVDEVYAPTAAVMYPPGSDTRVVPGALAVAMEGHSRPGHFDGVATVVTKLFAAVRPDVAVFGEKDFQQLAIVRRMAADLDLGVEIIGHPTVREADGLALSSRNRRLSPAARDAAICLPRAIAAAVAEAADPDATPEAVEAAARRVVAAEPLADLDYATVFTADDLRQVDSFDPARRSAGTYRIAVAARVGDVRLIDNDDLFG